MLSMTIENDPLLKEIYDQGGEYKIRRCLIENIEKGLMFHDITIDSRIEEFIPTADIKIIKSIHDSLMLFRGKEDFLQSLEDQLQTSFTNIIDCSKL